MTSTPGSAAKVAAALPAEAVKISVDPSTEPFWQAARERRLVAPRCADCGTFRLPPTPFCWRCQSAAVDWTELSGRGVVYTYTVVRHATHAALAGHLPYVIAIVELAEGPRIVTGLTGCDPADVRAGMAVQVRFEAVTDQVALPYFEPSQHRFSRTVA